MRTQPFPLSRLLLCCALVGATACAATGAAWSEAAFRPQGPAGAPASAFPSPDRPVAGIVSPHWGEPVVRDRAAEASQIAARLGVRPGMTIADIGSGDGYDVVRLAGVVGPMGRVVAEDIMPRYLDLLQDQVRSRRLANVVIALGEPQDPRLTLRSLDAAIMVHMYHEISQPYALLYNLAPAFKPGARLGVEERDAPTGAHGTPPALLACEFKAVGYREVSVAPMSGGLGYFAVFAPPAPDARPAPAQIKSCRL